MKNKSLGSAECLHTDCYYTRLGFSYLPVNTNIYNSLSNGEILLVDSASSDFKKTIHNAIKMRIEDKKRVQIFILSYDHHNIEVIDGIHFISKKCEIRAFTHYIQDSFRKKNTSVLLTFDAMKIIFLQTKLVDPEKISILTGKSKSTIKNTLSYTKRKLFLKNRFSERALIEIISCILNP